MTREELIAAAKEKERRQQLIQQAIAKHEAEVNQLNAENNQGLLSKYVMPAVDYTARGLDYAGGLVRTAIADAALPAEQIAGEDWQKALRGQALPSSEILKRSGVSEIATLSDALPELYSKDDSGLLRKGGWADPSARGALGLALDVVADPLTYFTLGASNLGKAGKLLKPGSAALESGGKAIYKSGLKRIDQEALKYGKEPVSDVLMKYGISGSADAIQKQMDNLSEKLLSERNNILKEATRAGGEVSMKDAVKPLLSEAADLKAMNNPMFNDLIAGAEGEAGKFLKLDAKPPEPILRELPVKADYLPSYTEVNITPSQERLFDLPVGSPEKLSVVGDYNRPARSQTAYEIIPGNVEIGKTIPEQIKYNKPQTVFDYSDAVMGPTPIQANSYKTSLASILPDEAWRDSALLSKRQKLEKSAAAGMRAAIEDSVSKSLGQEKGLLLRNTNDELGRILTTQDKAASEAAKEANKNAFTSVDAMIAGSNNPTMLAVKKAADLAKMTGPRTNVGKFLYEQGRGKTSGPVWDMLLRQAVIGANQEDQ